MATRENQSLQVALMVFAILVVLLAVTTYVGFKSASDRGKSLADANQRLSQANQALGSTQAEANRYKELMGFPIEEKLEAIDKGVAEAMQKYAAGFPAEKQVFQAVVEYLANEVQAITQRETATREREQALKADLARVQQDAAQQLQKYAEQLKAVTDDAQAKAAEFQRIREEMQQAADGLAKQIEEKRAEIAQVTSQYEAKVKELTDKSDKLEVQLFRVSREKEELVKGTFDVPDGNIARVNQGSQTVWINLGRSDGLMPRVVFSVYDAGENNATTAVKKGSIEVTKLLGGNMSEARILNDDVSNPIVQGDQIYSPVWHRGRGESFALAGRIDIDGDGRSDTERVRNLIKVNGGLIDAEIGPQGDMVGQVTVNTRYLVRGDEPEVEEGQDAAAVKKALDAFSEMNRQADYLGVEKISVQEFLDRMGWRAEDRTVRIGRGADPNDFPAEPPDGFRADDASAAAAKFRRRHPPQPSARRLD